MPHLTVWDSQEYRWMCPMPKCSAARVPVEGVYSLSPPWWWREPGRTAWVLSCLLLWFPRGFLLGFLPPPHSDAWPHRAWLSYHSGKRSVKASSDKGIITGRVSHMPEHPTRFQSLFHGGYHNLRLKIISLKWIGQILLPCFTNQEIELYGWLTDCLAVWSWSCHWVVLGTASVFIISQIYFI